MAGTTSRTTRWLCFGALLATGCASTPPAPERRPTAADYPGELLPPTALGVEVLWQQRVTAHWGQGEQAEQRGFDAALQLRAGVLTVIGLSPLGQPGFVIQHSATGTKVENHSDMVMPFPPEFVLLDVQRTFYPWLPGTPPTDGERAGDVGAERVTETWRGGQLVRRTFERRDGQPAGRIAVECTWSAVATRAPSHIVLDNGWCGYRLVIETHREQLL
jgi:hypothetical protein